ncbi:MAG: N-acetylmuramoyl-L-alanine amidase AmiC precursor [candidate division BRC1 bacterium ADurb.BinA292]|nr:MAG: N-acetylmuramoyl-L-alanine amidase AmiC precursor [candidate division BRC1 bacterium ADurb.BinA292]
MSAPPLRSVGLLLCLLLCASPGAAQAAGSRLLNFSWDDSADEPVFTIAFDRSPTLKATDALVEKRYFHLDFYGVDGPTAPEDWDITQGPVFHVKRLYYAQGNVLRFVFYARRDLQFHVTTQGEGVYQVRLGDSRKKLVVIDAGHGGKPTDAKYHFGASTTRKIGGRHYLEKELTLEISRRLADLIKQAPNLDCFMTRTDDRYVSLDRRIELANEVQGDLFVSIHLNATDSRRKTARGFEVYYLGDSSKATNRHLLALENEYEGDMDSQVSSHEVLREILRSLADDAFRAQQAESRAVAESVDREFAAKGPFRQFHRGVKSAAFRVLMTSMPSILVECGYLDNPDEAEQLVRPEVQQQIAILLFNGINRYFAEVDPAFKPVYLAAGGG